MKQVLTILFLVAILWVGFSWLKSELRPSTVQSVSVKPNLTIDGHAVEEVFIFSNGRVVDGDSVRLQTDGGGEFDLRLASIDAPELAQPFGSAAKQRLQDLLSVHPIVAWQIGTDRYGRRLVFLLIEQTDGSLFEINSQMIRDGLAWHYRQHSVNSVLDALESEARAARIGLWGGEKPVAPWDFRNR